MFLRLFIQGSVSPGQDYHHSMEPSAPTMHVDTAATRP